jgi:hypothetical protein
MKRRPKELTIFSLSALDVLAMSTGVFVLVLVWLMPFYRKDFDAAARIQATRAEAVATAAQAMTIEDAIRVAEERAADASADVPRITAEALALEREAVALRAQAMRKPQAPPKPVPTPLAADEGDRDVVNAMDLVFVVDTTASMTPVLRDMAASMRSIVRILERLVPSLRIGIVAYKDRDTGLPPVETSPLAPAGRDLARILGFIDRMQASPVGSRTVDEDVYLGLQAAVAMPFRSYAKQALVFIGDAPAHPYDEASTFALAQSFVRQSPDRWISALFVSTPGSRARGNIDRGFFQRLATAGGGSFNDHAGSMVESVLLSVLLE